MTDLKAVLQLTCHGATLTSLLGSKLFRDLGDVVLGCRVEVSFFEELALPDASRCPKMWAPQLPSFVWQAYLLVAHLGSAKSLSTRSATITNYGATLTSLWVRDRSGNLGDVVLGYDTLAGYEAHVVSMGQTVGRFANRIANGRFVLDGKEYRLAQNNGTNCLHGGVWSFDNLTWDIVSATGSSVLFQRVSPDMDEGFPGTLTVNVEYSLASAKSGETVLRIKYGAETDQATVVNLTNHRQAGHSGEARHPDILDHVVSIHADTVVHVDDRCIPTGRMVPVADLTVGRDAPFDFRQPRRIGDGIDAPSSQLIYCDGYDHCFVLNAGQPRTSPEGAPQGLRELGIALNAAQLVRSRPADAVLEEPMSGRRMEVFTEEPGLHFFTNNIPQSILGLGGRGKHGVEEYTYRTGVCFETQHLPDSPNQPSFPSTVLRPGARHQSETVFVFGVS
ncbi:mro [Symbiodinium natans]|uniref:Mro protein n=1 Tax=Symbiodinium natans TaxID=878477 RepID=A0A812U8U1_9DINO|nr:mro [Symbiodinium natans]